MSNFLDKKNILILGMLICIGVISWGYYDLIKNDQMQLQSIIQLENQISFLHQELGGKYLEVIQLNMTLNKKIWEYDNLKDLSDHILENKKLPPILQTDPFIQT